MLQMYRFFFTYPNRSDINNVNRKRSRLFEFDDGDAGATKLDVFVFEVLDTGEGGEVVADELAEDAGACAVQYPDRGNVGEDGIVNKVGDSLKGFVATHTAYIYFVFEMEFFLVDGIGCLGADKSMLFYLFFQLILADFFEFIYFNGTF